MAADALEVRMARLEGAYEQINTQLQAIWAGMPCGPTSAIFVPI
jgi:hypothetical protein